MDEERQGAAAQVQYIETVDEEELPAESARRLSRNHKSLALMALPSALLAFTHLQFPVHATPTHIAILTAVLSCSTVLCWLCPTSLALVL